MREKTLLKVALLCSVVGLAIIFFITGRVEVDEVIVQRIDNVGDDIKIVGEIQRISDAGSVMFINIERPEVVTVVVFTDRNISLATGQTIEVIGEIEEYEGELEILAERIRIIN